MRRSLHFPKLLAQVRCLSRSTEGSVVTIFAIALPVIAVAVTATAELAEVQTAKTEFQNAVDTAAMNGAGEYAVDQSSATIERARLMADGLATPLKQRWTVTSSAQSNASTGALTVTVSASRPSLFGNLVPPGGFQLRTSATALANSSMPLCVLAIKPSSTNVMALGATAAITASGCLVQSDSDITVAPLASITAGAVRSVGSEMGPTTPTAVADAPGVTDPFASLPITVPTTCTDQGLSASTGSNTLAAGVHCGPVQTQGSASVTLAPGEHYFLNANINMNGTGQLAGTNVVVVLSGTSQIQFQGSAALSLDGRQSGPYAGFALISDRNYTGTVNISTASAHELLGTVYLPAATLTLSGNNKVGDNSAWTVVVANSLQVQGSANLVVNSNYTSSNVPVPAGVGSSGTIQLLK